MQKDTFYRAILNCKWYKTIFKVILLLIYSFFCYLILRITLQYLPINFDVAFLRIKQNYTHLKHYNIAFYIHVLFSIFALLAGFTQFSKTIRLKTKKIHRAFGWLYIVIILLFAAPSGLLIAIYANGGFCSRLAFCLLAVLWFYFTLKAYLTVRSKNYRKHQIFMIRSFALTLSAITLRLWKYVIVSLFHPNPMDTYQIVAWLGWTLNLIIAELIIYKYLKK